jgi:outer membrane immunogenic protein
MRRLLLGIVSAVVLSAAGAAGAADLPLKAPPPPPPELWSWTGFYFGGHVGAGWGAKDWEFTEEGDFLPSSFPVNGFLGGVQAGYRWQTGHWVWGIEGSFSGADINGQSGCVEFAVNCQSRVDWLATATAQVGWTVDHALLYIKGGAAWAGDKDTLSFPIPVESPCSEVGVNCSHNETRLGALFGAGITYAFDPHWSGFIEYNYMDFGTTTTNFNECEGSVCVPFATFKIDQQIHVIKAGVNYKFDW